MRIVLRLRDGKVITGYATAFDPQDGSVMVMLSPTSPAGSLIDLDSVELLVLEPTDGKALPAFVRRPVEPSPGVRVVFADGTLLIGAGGVVDGLGVWMCPPEDHFARAFIPQGAARYVELLDQAPSEVPAGMWAFLNDSTPTDEVEVPTGPTDVTEMV